MAQTSPRKTPQRAASEDESEDELDAGSIDNGVSEDAADAADEDDGVDEAVPEKQASGRPFISALADNHLDARKGRGRPKKAQSTNNAYGESDADAGAPLDPNSDFIGLDDAPEKTAPAQSKGRGRPRKSEDAAVNGSAKLKTAASSSAAASKSKGRGRPPKSDAAKAAAPKSALGKRGRPRKSDAAAETDDDDAEPAKAVSSGRGRPRKSDVAAEVDDEDVEPTEAVSRGRGRPRTSGTAPKTTPTSSKSKGRGRPPKPASEKAKPKAASSTGRGRGRPRKSLDGTSSASDPPMSDTDTDTPGQDDSAILALPPELLSRVFAYLGAGSRTDVSSCRLVCRSFHQLSSPFLLTTVVFAKRLETLQRLREVVDHPYFSKHVTHLIWDASYYEGQVAGDWGEYVTRCSNAPRHLLDRDWAQTETNDTALLRSLETSDRQSFAVDVNRNAHDAFPSHGVTEEDEANADPNTNVDSALECSSNELSSLGLDSSTDSDLLPVSVDDDDSAEDSITHSDASSNSDGFLDGSDISPGAEDWQDDIYRMGCHRGLPDYYRLWRNENHIKAAELPTRMLAQAIKRLPKLRHLEFTDFRGLARCEESFDALCRRLFGNTLQPESIGLIMPGREITKVLNVFTGLNCRLASFSIGWHPFDHCLLQPGIHYVEDTSIGPGMHEWLAKQIRDSPRNAFYEVLKNVRSLNLPIAMDCLWTEEEGAGEVLDVTPVVRALGAATSSLLELQLVMREGMVTYPEKPSTELHFIAPPSSDGSESDMLSARDVFAPISKQVRFERLRILELRGWEFSSLDLHVFLCAHADTLRDLHIIDGLCTGSYAAFAMTAGRWSSMLHLTGVEICALSFSECGTLKDSQCIRDHDYHDKALRMAALDGRGMRSPWTPQVTLQQYPFGRLELEAMVMGDRSNGISRRAGFLAAPAPGGKKWWEVPVRL